MKHIILTFFTILIFVSGFAQGLQRDISNKNSVSFEENITSSDVRIYPNPCKQEKVTIEFNKHVIKEIKLTNILGKEVLIKRFPLAENKKQVELNEVPDGLYLIQIKTNDNKLVVKKLMVSRN